MKKKEILSLAVISLLLIGIASACKHTAATPQASEPMQVENYDMTDSARYAHLTMEIELPVADGKAASAIRNRLVEVMGQRLSRVASYENDQYFPLFSGNSDDSQALFSYYHQQTLGVMDSLSREDADQRITYINEAEDLTPEEKAQQMSEIPSWEYHYTLKKMADTLSYVVFLSQEYTYLGGAHGGVGGDGCLTFDREDGSLVGQMIEADSVEAMQPLLVEGLLSYYSDSDAPLSEADMRDRLQIEGDIIPLPVQQPYPSKDGLVFTYNQYEIASYADGMPSFVIPFDKIAPFMTPQARKVCGL